MNTRIPALLAALALGVVALTGCSAATGDADDLAGAGPAHVEAIADDASPTYVAVTPLSEADFDEHEQDATCVGGSGITYCQELEGDQDTGVTWTAYIAVPFDPIDATMTIGTGTGADATYTAPVRTDSSYAQVTWGSPQIQAVPSLSTDVRVTLHDGSTYAATSHPSLDADGMYSEDDLALNPV